MRRALALLCAVLLAACTTPPRTAEELREGKGGGMGLSKRESYDVNREFTSVVNDVKRKSMECLRFAYTRTFQSGVHYSQNTTIYNVRMNSAGSGKAEMTVQWDRMPRAAHDPQGGYYVFVADIQKTSANKTRVTMYGSSFPTWRPIFAAVKGWAEGQNVKCPDTP